MSERSIKITSSSGPTLKLGAFCESCNRALVSLFYFNMSFIWLGSLETHLYLLSWKEIPCLRERDSCLQCMEERLAWDNHAEFAPSEWSHLQSLSPDWDSLLKESLWSGNRLGFGILPHFIWIICTTWQDSFLSGQFTLIGLKYILNKFWLDLVGASAQFTRYVVS